MTPSPRLVTGAAQHEFPGWPTCYLVVSTLPIFVWQERGLALPTPLLYVSQPFFCFRVMITTFPSFTCLYTIRSMTCQSLFIKHCSHLTIYIFLSTTMLITNICFIYNNEDHWYRHINGSETSLWRVVIYQVSKDDWFNLIFGSDIMQGLVLLFIQVQ